MVAGTAWKGFPPAPSLAVKKEDSFRKDQRRNPEKMESKGKKFFPASRFLTERARHREKKKKKEESNHAEDHHI